MGDLQAELANKTSEFTFSCEIEATQFFGSQLNKNCTPWTPTKNGVKAFRTEVN